MEKVLSQRQTEILRLIAEGKESEEIASQLSLKNQTVRNHIYLMMKKLEVTNRTRAVVLALKLGILNLGELE